MFADDTNLFYSHQNIKTLRTVNCELEKICEWFRANKLSLNVTKTNYTLFYKNSAKHTLPLKMPELKIGNSIIKRKSSVMLDENISWKEHIKTIKATNIGLLYRAKPYLDGMSLKTIYFSYIHSYLNYANIAWASTRITKLKPLLYKQKQAVRIVFNEGRLNHLKPLFKTLNALNVCKINLYQHLNFMYRLENSNIPAFFNDIVKKPEHKYPTKFSSLNYTLRKYSFTNSRFAISFRGPKLWNEILNKEEKGTESHTFFKKCKLLDMENEYSYF